MLDGLGSQSEWGRQRICAIVAAMIASSSCTLFVRWPETCASDPLVHIYPMALAMPTGLRADQPRCPYASS